MNYYIPPEVDFDALLMSEPFYHEYGPWQKFMSSMVSCCFTIGILYMLGSCLIVFVVFYWTIKGG